MNFDRPASASLLMRDGQPTSLSTLVFRLDEVFPLEKLDRLDYVKIDIEGAEAQALAGARATLAKFRPIVQLETGIAGAQLDLRDYCAYQSPGGPNRVCLPNESPKIAVAQQLGWKRVT